MVGAGSALLDAIRRAARGRLIHAFVVSHRSSHEDPNPGNRLNGYQSPSGEPRTQRFVGIDYSDHAHTHRPDRHKQRDEKHRTEAELNGAAFAFRLGFHRRIIRRNQPPNQAGRINHSAIVAVAQRPTLEFGRVGGENQLGIIGRAVMNPYSALYSNPVDILSVCVFVVAWLGLGTAVSRLRNYLRGSERNDIWWDSARSFLALCVLIGAADSFMLVFLVLLRVSSPIWAVFDLVWMMGVIAVFYVLPIVCILLVGWAIADRRHDNAAQRAFLKVVACPMALVLNVALYFVLELALIARK
jgi:hypothetical protein